MCISCVCGLLCKLLSFAISLLFIVGLVLLILWLTGIIFTKPFFTISRKVWTFVTFEMLYNSDFAIQSFKQLSPANRNAFNVILQKPTKKENKTYSVAYAYKPLLYFSTLFAMNSFTFSKNKMNKNNLLNKFYCLALIAGYIFAIAILRPKIWQKIEADLPLSIVSKTFGVSLNFEIIYNIFIISFSNSANYYITLLEILDNVDDHFGRSKNLYLKRRTLATVLSIIPLALVCVTGFFENIRIANVLRYATLIFVLLQGVTILYFIILIYGQLVFLNMILLAKSGKMSPSKQQIFKSGVIKKFLLKISIHTIPIPVGDDNPAYSYYCWLELMQIYDKISDCVYIFNKIYAAQILFMFYSWFLSTMLIICRSLSPTLKNISVKTDAYYYFFINLRPFVITKISEYLIQEWRDTLAILIHILINGEPNRENYRQIKTLIKLVETKKLQMSAVVCPVTINVFAAFAARVISYSVLLIQQIYIRH